VAGYDGRNGVGGSDGVKGHVGTDGMPGQPGQTGFIGFPGPDRAYCPCPDREQVEDEAPEVQQELGKPYLGSIL